MTLFIAVLVIAAVIALVERERRRNRGLDAELEVLCQANADTKDDLADPLTREAVSALLAERYPHKELDALHRRAKQRRKRYEAQCETFKDSDQRSWTRARIELDRMQQTEELLAGSIGVQVRSSR
ncbi:hypothetical protein M4D50_10975 [Rothia sp. p3-SID1597]|nr:hypothetical protein [Rothia sp. p3-SID1597]